MKDYKVKEAAMRKSINYNSRLLAKDKNRLKDLEGRKPFDDESFNKGAQFFNDGLSLGDAPLDLRDNVYFVNGFNRAKRISEINESLRILGAEWRQNGIPLDSAPENYKNNPYFIDGYNNSLKKGL